LHKRSWHGCHAFRRPLITLRPKYEEKPKTIVLLEQKLTLRVPLFTTPVSPFINTIHATLQLLGRGNVSTCLGAKSKSDSRNAFTPPGTSSPNPLVESCFFSKELAIQDDGSFVEGGWWNDSSHYLDFRRVLCCCARGFGLLRTWFWFATHVVWLLRTFGDCASVNLSIWSTCRASDYPNNTSGFSLLWFNGDRRGARHSVRTKLVH
jgi:hypothetical protein